MLELAGIAVLTVPVAARKVEANALRDIFRFGISLFSSIPFLSIELLFREIITPFLDQFFEGVRGARPDVFGASRALRVPPSMSRFPTPIAGKWFWARLLKPLKRESRMPRRLVA